MEHTRDAKPRQKTSAFDYCGIGILLLFPLALHLMFNSVAMLTEAGSLGTTLASPTGHFTLLIATLLFATVSYLRWHTEVGLQIMIFWAGFWVALTLAASIFSWPELGETIFFSGATPTLLSWSQLPLLFLLITLATANTTLIKEIKLNRRSAPLSLPQLNPKPKAPQLLSGSELIGVHTDSLLGESIYPPRRKRPLSSLQACGLTVVLGALLFGVLFLLAPRTSAPLITKEYEQLLSFGFLHLAGLVVSCILVFTIAWLCVNYPLPAQLAIWLTLALPGLVICPLTLTLLAISATPHTPYLIALSMALPVAGSLGISISAFGAMHLAYAR